MIPYVFIDLFFYVSLIPQFKGRGVTKKKRTCNNCSKIPESGKVVKKYSKSGKASQSLNWKW